MSLQMEAATEARQYGVKSDGCMGASRDVNTIQGFEECHSPPPHKVAASLTVHISAQQCFSSCGQIPYVQLVHRVAGLAVCFWEIGAVPAFSVKEGIVRRATLKRL